MIRVNSVPAAPVELTDAESVWLTERDRAKAYWNERGTMKGFKFRAYKEPAVTVALEKVFLGKCAYCEYRYDAGAPCEVEHYRPKGGVEVDGQVVEPGYYWLAGEWTNLLPSCVDCNRARYHEFPDADEEMLGKANKFPIGNPAQRAAQPGEEQREDRLLLHPYFDNPQDHLTFVDEGVVQPNMVAAGQPSPMGVASIATYGLHRPKLTQARRDVWLRVAASKKVVKQTLVLLNEQPNNAGLKELLQDQIKILKSAAGEREIFLGMVRQLLEPMLDLMNEN